MLDEYIEKTTQKKVQIFLTLYLNRSISVQDLSQKVNIRFASLLSLIDEMNLDFEGIGHISKNISQITLTSCGELSFLEAFHALHQNSDVLACLRFLLTNDNHESFSEFAESHFLTRPSAYRIRQNCAAYLQMIGLDIDQNYVVGEEYRIRFLIGLLHYKYGIECYEMDDDSIRIAREFILATNDKIDMHFLEHTSAEYGYFEYLLILAWKRKEFPVTFEQGTELDALKQLSVYPKLKTTLKASIEIPLDISFSEADYNYIYLVYCATNSCLFADQWSYDDLKALAQMVYEEPVFHSLIVLFEEKYGLEISHSYAFKTVLVHFFKKCLLNLQCIIPDKHFYVDSIKDPSLLMTRGCVEELIHQWQKENNRPYPVADGHLHYLSLQFYSILQQFMEPVKIVVISDLLSEIEVFKLYLSRAFSKQRITIFPLFLNAVRSNTLLPCENSVIVVKKIFAPAVSAMDFSKKSTIVPVNIEINEQDRHNISEAVIQCEKRIMEEFIRK